MANDGPDAPAALEHPTTFLMHQMRVLTEALDRAEAAAVDGGTPYERDVHAAARLLLVSVRQVTEVSQHGAYHWVLTVNGTVAGRQTLLSESGVVRPEADDTRQSVCDRLVADLCAKSEQVTGQPYHDARVLFFDLQPNALEDRGYD